MHSYLLVGKARKHVSIHFLTLIQIVIMQQKQRCPELTILQLFRGTFSKQCKMVIKPHMYKADIKMKTER